MHMNIEKQNVGKVEQDFNNLASGTVVLVRAIEELPYIALITGKREDDKYVIDIDGSTGSICQEFIIQVIGITPETIDLAKKKGGN